MRIKDEYLETVVYLYKNEKDAKNGEKIGASGFLVLIEYENVKNQYHIYAVTARHVVGGMDQCPVIRVNRRDGGIDIIKTKEEEWIHDSNYNDLSIYLLKEINIKTQKILGISIKDFITEEIVKEKYIGIGDNIFMIGRFLAWDGGEINKPSVRYGRISIMPPQMIHNIPLANAQETIFVEMLSSNGYSGSATFLYILPGLPRPPSYNYDYNAFYQGLLGIDWGHLQAEGRNSGMACIIPAWKIQGLFFSRNAIEQRRSLEADQLETNITLEVERSE